MDLTIPIDAYCERIGTGFWAEPLNALSNVAFFAAAALGLWYWRQAASRDRGRSQKNGRTPPPKHPAVAVPRLMELSRRERAAGQAPA